MEDLTGKQFGPYQIVAPLGEGGMAAVYKAFQPSMERYVAIKVLPRHMASTEEFVSRFKREAKLLAQLQHPHILPVFDYGEAEGYPYIVMTFVKSGTLADLMQKRRLSLAEIRRMMTQIGEALQYAHARHMIHRDIKPSNVLIDEMGNCRLTDFGLARMTESATKITTSGTVMGTPAYMSPEQGAGSEIDHRSDIYSLGVIFYEMVTGRVPYTAETPVAIVFKHIQDPLPSARKLNPNLPESVEMVLLKALAKNPADRYQSAEAFTKAIQHAIPEAGYPEQTLIAPEKAPVEQKATELATQKKAAYDAYARVPEQTVRPRKSAWLAVGAIGGIFLLCVCGFIALRIFPSLQSAGSVSIPATQSISTDTAVIASPTQAPPPTTLAPAMPSPTSVIASERLVLDDSYLLAYYTLRNTLEDSQGNYSDIAINNAPFSGGGIFCNGIYRYSAENITDYCLIETPVLWDFNYRDFTFSVDFNVSEFPQGDSMPVIVGGPWYRWIGVFLTSDGNVGMQYNNDNYMDCEGRYRRDTWHNLTLTYDGKVGRLYLDEEPVCKVDFKINTGGGDDDKIFTTTNYSIGATFRGIIRDLKIYSIAFTP
jgi:serine/threonine protein kinase